MTRNRASAKAAGREWEKAICDYLISRGWIHVERRRLEGVNDRGDVAGIPGVVVEAKNVSKLEVASFLDEANHEADNAGGAHGVAWIKRRGKASPANGYVLMDGATFTNLLKEAGY